MTQTSEKAFETNLEQTLLTTSGWTKADNTGWDVDLALFPALITQFLETSQPVLWAQMRTMHGTALEDLIVKALVKELSSKGSLTVLRHGFKFYGKLFKMAFFKPAHGLNPEVERLYGLNLLTVSRQVRCKPSTNQSVDVLLALNGIPVATMELKNPMTGQTWRNAVEQYQTDRDPRAPLFVFKHRALVHFAVDPFEVYMTTRLRGDATHFLPFNRGSHPGETQCGAGNPAHPSGYASEYLWHEVLARDSFLEILGQFLFIERKEEEKSDGMGGVSTTVHETMVFPRYHQLDSVRALVAAARADGAGQNYLIQHSAGSGKTNSISWLSHRLASLHNRQDQKIFDCVVVITDRKVLDAQLQDAIYQIEHAQGVVKAIDKDSRQLATALIDGTQIVITTLQKFPFVLRGLLYATGAQSQEQATELEKETAKEFETRIAARRYAVIVDEAHSSQTGEAARELKQILGANSQPLSEDSDWEDRLNAVMESRGKQGNLSFFAFTATPKGKTLELFGSKKGDKPEAFRTYSMRQAIEEGFILDVLQNYTTYKTYFNLLNAAENDPNLPKKRAVKALTKFVDLHPHNIEQKTEVIVEHFRRSVKFRLGGRAKAMVVTASRLAAVRYRLAVDRYLSEQGYDDMAALVAFSGTVLDPDTNLEYTETGMNKDVNGKSISESSLPERFESADFQILLVANKYQTGFDQPLLQAMYVDKRLDGVQAVQTLSRLNRKIPGKNDTFVLDFVNDQDDIFKAFKPYFDATKLQENSDPARLEALKHELDSAQVYFASEVEGFARIFYKPLEQQTAADHARLSSLTRPAVERFSGLSNEERSRFRDGLAAFVTLYAFISQIIPYTDDDHEKLYSFARMLLPQLPVGGERSAVVLGDDVNLQFYRLERVGAGAIDLSGGETQGVRSPTAVGTGSPEEPKAPLSEILEVLNNRFGTAFNEADRLFFAQIKAQAILHEGIVSSAHANELDRFELGIKRILESLMLERMTQNDDIVTRYMGDAEFQGLALPILAREIYQAIRGQQLPPKS
jgi:type I restriction enzyme, R subunit